MAEPVKSVGLGASALAGDEEARPQRRLDLKPRRPLEQPLPPASLPNLRPVADKAQKLLAKPKAKSRWQQAAALAQIAPLRLNYRMGDIAVPLNDGKGPNYKIRVPSYTAVFAPSERQELAALLAKGENFSDGDWIRLRQIADSADKWAALWQHPFTWLDNHGGTETYSPVEGARLRKLVCRDWHTLSSSGLRHSGRASVVYGYTAPGDFTDPNIGNFAHAFSLDQNESGGWDGREYERIYATNEKNSLRAFMRIAPDALLINKYELSADPNVRPIERGIIETQAGLEIKRFFTNQMLPHAGIAALDAEDAYEGKNLRAAMGSNGVSVSLQLKELDLNAHSWSAPASALGGVVDVDPMLRQAFGASVGFRPWRNLRLSAGMINLPEAYNYSVGARLRNSHPLFIAFAGLQLQTPALVLARNQADTLQWSVSGSYVGTQAKAFNQSKGGFWHNDEGVKQALIHSDVMAKTELAWQARRALRVWASVSTYLPLESMRWQLKFGNKLSQLNYTAFSEAGVTVGDSRIVANPSFYMPWITTTNLFADEARWQIPFYARIGKYASFAAVVDGQVVSRDPAEFVRSAYIGLRAMGVGAFIGAHTFNQEFYPAAQVNVDLGELLRAVH